MAQKIGLEELRQKVESGSVKIVEALPPEYYTDKHLPGALNMPHDQVDELAPKLLADKDAPVVVYCSNSACKNSAMASTRLDELGYTNVFMFEEGKQAWVEAGLPVETGASVGVG